MNEWHGSKVRLISLEISTRLSVRLFLKYLNFSPDLRLAVSKIRIMKPRTKFPREDLHLGTRHEVSFLILSPPPAPAPSRESNYDSETKERAF